MQSQLIIVLLLILIPFASTNLTYDPTTIKTTLIKTGIVIILALYLIRLVKAGATSGATSRIHSSTGKPALFWFGDKKTEVKKKSPVFFLALFSAYVIVNFILKYPFASSENLFTLVLFFSLFFVLAHLSVTRRFIRLIIGQFFIITSLIGFICLIYYFTHHQRAHLFFYNPNFLASFFVFSIPLGLCLLYERYKKYQDTKQLTKMDLLFYLLLLIQIMGFITTFSRAGSLGFSAAILFLIALKGSKKWRQVSIFLLLMIICGSILMVSMPQIFTDFLGVRAPIWQGTKNMIKQNLLTGHGIGSFSKIYPSFRPPQYFTFLMAAPVTLHAHNEFLEILAELGIIGLLLGALFLASLFYVVLKGIDRTDASSSLFIHGTLAGITGLFIQNIFSMSLRVPFISFYFWLGSGMSMALIKGKNFAPLSRPQRRLIFAFLLTLIIWAPIKSILFPFLGDFYSEKGYLEQARGNLSPAINYYTKALNFSHEPQEIYYRRAFILIKTGKEKDALADYLKIEKISPGYAKIYLNTGITYLSLGDIDNAIVTLKKAIAMNPYDSHSHNSLGAAYAKKGCVKKAKKEFQYALSINPGLKEARLNLIKLDSACK